MDHLQSSVLPSLVGAQGRDPLPPFNFLPEVDMYQQYRTLPVADQITLIMSHGRRHKRATPRAQPYRRTPKALAPSFTASPTTHASPPRPQTLSKPAGKGRGIKKPRPSSSPCIEDGPAVGYRTGPLQLTFKADDLTVTTRPLLSRVNHVIKRLVALAAKGKCTSSDSHHRSILPRLRVLARWLNQPGCRTWRRWEFHEVNAVCSLTLKAMLAESSKSAGEREKKMARGEFPSVRLAWVTV